MPTDNRIMIPTDDRQRAMWVIGLPGSGKSWALESWIFQDALAGRGCGFLDPAADSYNRLLTRLTNELPTHPDLANRLVIIDPINPKWTVGFNPLEPIEGVYPERVGKFMTDVILKIWKMDVGDAPRTVRLLNATFTALVELKMTLLDLPRFLGDRDWRESLLPKISSPVVGEYFAYEFPKSDKEAAQWVAPTLTRLGALIDDPDTRLMLGIQSTINFRKLMDEQGILLVNLSKGQLSAEGSWLLGAFVVAQIQKAALSRADSPNRPRFYLYLDEFQNYTTANIQDVLAEARKYGLSLILAHQFIDQLKGELKSAVTNITGAVCAFLASEDDAPFLAKVLFPPGSFDTTQAVWEGGQLKQKTNTFSPAQVQWQLGRLRPREFWMRQRGDNPPFKMRAFNFPEPPMTEELSKRRDQLIETVMARCGKLKSEARAEMNAKRAEFRKFTNPTQQADDLTDIDTKADEP